MASLLITSSKKQNIMPSMIEIFRHPKSLQHCFYYCIKIHHQGRIGEDIHDTLTGRSGEGRMALLQWVVSAQPLGETEHMLNFAVALPMMHGESIK